MHSSISNSDVAVAGQRSVVGAAAGMILLGVSLCAYFGALEFAIRKIVPTVSRSAQRAKHDYQAAIALRPTTPTGARTVLLVGNSLLLHAVDRRLLEESVGPRLATTVFPVENTSGLDWYFGLRRYLSEGSRPSFIGVCLAARQMAMQTTNGEAFASTMMRRSDLLEVTRAARLDATTASNYYFATYSDWLGNRAGLRNWLLEMWLPNASTLVGYFTPRGGTPLGEAEVVARALPAMQRLAATARDYDIPLIFIWPPSSNREDPVRAVDAAATGAGLKGIMVYRPGELPAAMFSDGFHLNPDGAAQFTQRLGPALDATLR